jgi:hypothetical protein
MLRVCAAHPTTKHFSNPDGRNRQNFALLEGSLVLAMMALYSEICLTSGLNVGRDVVITMRPKGGLPVKPFPRV